MPDTHALLSASAAKRWLNCPPSVRLTENMPDTASEYAAEGTLAHSLGELKVRKKFEIMKKSEYDKRLKAIKADPLFTAEMDSRTDTYLDYVAAIMHSYTTKPYIAIEKRLDYSHIAPGGFGTGDCLVMCGGDLHIIDFKYGRGVPVSAEDNPQLKLYALGAVREYEMLYDIQNITLHIVQPRTEDGNSSWSIPRAALDEWGESIKPIAQLAYDGKGEFHCGEHCRFCKAKAVCRARAEFILSEAEFSALPPELLSDEELGKILERAKLFANWLSDVEEYALNEILSGKTVAGFKAVEGRSNRKITDIDKAFELLKESGFDEALLYERKPLGLTELEKLVGGKSKLTEIIGGYIEKPRASRPSFRRTTKDPISSGI